MSSSIDAINGNGMSLQFEEFARLAGTSMKDTRVVRFLGTNGGTLCQNPDTDAYVLMRPVPLAPLEGEEAVGAILEETLAQVDRWKQNLNGMREAEDTLGTQVAEERAAFDAGAFIQV